MPWSMSNPPPPAKHWTDAQKQKCVAAANSVLRDTGDESKAIYACIHAAGKSTRTKQGPDDYDKQGTKIAERFQKLVDALLAGTITLSLFREQMQSGIRENYVAMANLALDGKRELTTRDMQWIDSRVEREYEYLNGMIEDYSSGRTTPDRLKWRAGLYGFPRAAYANFKIDPDVSALMPQLPGDDCLGGSLCKCSLQEERDSDGNYLVYWLLDPTAESCPVCIVHATESPYVFSEEDVLNASRG